MINILIIAVLGGMRHPIGAFIGAILFVLLQNFAIDIIDRERFNLVIGGVFLRSSCFLPTGCSVCGRYVRIRLAGGVQPNPRAGALDRRAGSRPEQNGGRQPTDKRRKTMSASRAGLLGTAFGPRFSPSRSRGAASAQETIKIGAAGHARRAVRGPAAQDGMRGAELALKHHNGMAGGKKIEFIKYSSDATPDKAVDATRKAVEQDKVHIMIGPLSGDEGIAVKNYSKTQPDMTFINGSSGAQATTLQDPSPNFYRFNTEGAQWMVGLGEYALAKGYKKMFLISEDYGFPYSQVQGFMASYCAKGGKVVEKAWVPLGTKDYASVDRQIPQDVDALLVVLGGSDAVNFLTQYEQAGGDKPIVGGSITVDQTVLNYKGKQRESLLGTASAGPMADGIDTPEWKKFVADYKATFKDGFPSPSLFAYLYYINTQAALDGLDAVKGDLSDDQTKLNASPGQADARRPAGTSSSTTTATRSATPTSPKSPRARRRVLQQGVKVVNDVSQTLGLPKDEFDKMGLGSRDVPNCP